MSAVETDEYFYTPNPDDPRALPEEPLPGDDPREAMAELQLKRGRWRDILEGIEGAGFDQFALVLEATITERQDALLTCTEPADMYRLQGQIQAYREVAGIREQIAGLIAGLDQEIEDLRVDEEAQDDGS